MVPVLDGFRRGDIKRFVSASHLDIELAAVQVVETAAWRGRTFPVDIRSCRIELQSAQLFQQGLDRSGNAVFYFSTCRRGPWRGNAEATIAAAMHRFETRLSRLLSENPETCCTLVIVLGSPTKTGKGSNSSSRAEEGDNSECDGDETAYDAQNKQKLCNPRIPAGERLKLHSTRDILEEFVFLIFKHYPEVVSRVIFVKGGGGKALYKTKIATTRALRRTIDFSNARNKVVFLPKMSKLKKFVRENEISEVAGGPVPTPDWAFDFC